jgi:hypothetical protein
MCSSRVDLRREIHDWAHALSSRPCRGLRVARAVAARVASAGRRGPHAAGVPPAIREYLAHYHRERNHQGLDSQLIVPPANLNRPGPIDCRERLGGLLRFYDREAA